MKVLAVTNMYPTPFDPGSGTFVEQQVTGLRRLGVDVRLLFIERRAKGMAAYLWTRSLVRASIAEFEPDLVHIMYGGIMADLATAAVDDRPTVITFHGSDLLGEKLAGPIRRGIAACGVWSSHRAARRARGIVVVAEALRQRLHAYTDPSRIRLIPCGIDLDRFKPMDQGACRRQLAWRNDRFHVLFNAGGGDPVKRPWLARAAVARLKDAGVAVEMHEMSGVRNDEVAVWLNASDVLLLTSLHEGSPTVVKEALACNLPIVSVVVGDVRDRIAGVEGCYLASADPDDLAAKLRIVHANGRRVDARRSVSALSLESTAMDLAAFYDELTTAGAVSSR
jgi:teichuronic acid biosynthesis glycosyltransferase TuaC